MLLLQTTIFYGSENQSYDFLHIFYIPLGLAICAEIFKIIHSIIISDKKIKDNKLDLIEKKKIEVLEKLFSDLTDLSFFYFENTDVVLEKTHNIYKFIDRNMLYIPEQIKNLSYDWMDYQYQISIKSATKNLKLEKELITKFKKELI